MNRLMENTVFSGFVMACRLATWPHEDLALLREGHHRGRQTAPS